jgi:hypothetical protein
MLQAVQLLATLLLAPGRDAGAAEIRMLLERWGKLHALRSALGLASAGLYWTFNLRDPERALPLLAMGLARTQATPSPAASGQFRRTDALFRDSCHGRASRALINCA